MANSVIPVSFGKIQSYVFGCDDMQGFSMSARLRVPCNIFAESCPQRIYATCISNGVFSIQAIQIIKGQDIIARTQLDGLIDASAIIQVANGQTQIAGLSRRIHCLCDELGRDRVGLAGFAAVQCYGAGSFTVAFSYPLHSRVTCVGLGIIVVNSNIFNRTAGVGCVSCTFLAIDVERVLVRQVFVGIINHRDHHGVAGAGSILQKQIDCSLIRHLSRWILS